MDSLRTHGTLLEGSHPGHSEIYELYGRYYLCIFTGSDWQVTEIRQPSNNRPYNSEIGTQEGETNGNS
jgi:hypothetical protein